jgi:hypothetical protein
MPQIILTHCIRMINLIPENQKGHFGQLLHAQKRIKLGLAFWQALVVLGVDEEDDAADFWKIVFPETARLLMAAEVEGGEAAVADGEFFGGGMEGGLENSDAVVLWEKGCQY